MTNLKKKGAVLFFIAALITNLAFADASYVAGTGSFAPGQTSTAVGNNINCGDIASVNATCIGGQTGASSGGTVVGAGSTAGAGATIMGVNTNGGNNSVMVGSNSNGGQNSLSIGNNNTIQTGNMGFGSGLNVQGVTGAVVFESISGYTATLRSNEFNVAGRSIGGVVAATQNDQAVNLGQMNSAISTAVSSVAGGGTDTNAIHYDAVSASPTTKTATLAGSNGTEIMNVAAGTTGTSAANVNQVNAALSQANSYTDSKLAGIKNDINGLKGDINNLSNRIDGANAMSAAQAAIIFNPYGSQYQLGVGTGASGSASALSLKFMGASNDRRYLFSVGVSASTSGGSSVGAGMSFNLN